MSQIKRPKPIVNKPPTNLLATSVEEIMEIGPVELARMYVMCVESRDILLRNVDTRKKKLLALGHRTRVEFLHCHSKRLVSLLALLKVH